MLRQRRPEFGGWRAVVLALVGAVGCGGGGTGTPVPISDARGESAGDGGGGALDMTAADMAPAPDVAGETKVDAMVIPGGVRVTPTSGLRTTERGAGQAMFTVVLTAQPTADVVITLESSMPTEGTASPRTLTFTRDNWNAPQTVTVTGVDDPVADGDVLYKIALAPATSSDSRYQGLDPEDVDVTNTDDESAGLTVAPKTPGMPLVTTETGGQAMFTVVLNSKPTAPVMVPVESADPSEGTATTTITFTPDNWNAPQTVTVTGVDDQEADGTVSYKIKVGPPSSADSKYAALMRVEVELTNTDNETAGVTVVPPEVTTTTEAGGKVMFLIFLNSKPTANVSISLSSSDPSEGTVAPASITFTPNNWNAPQVITATGVDDALSDGNQPFTVVTSATFSGDPMYNDLVVADVALSNTDNDSAGITVTAPMNLATSEAGRQVTFTVVLNSQPEANVVIPISSSDEGEGTVSAASLTFTASNWNAPQPVTVTGVDDFLADGSQPYSVVTGAAMSTDTKYNGVDPANVALTNTDNDTAGITITAEPFLTTTEAGGSATFTIVLNSQPTGNVVVPISSNDTTEGTISGTTLIFTPVNWNAPQTVTVTGVDDLVADGNQIYSVVTGAAMSADNAYHGIDPPNVLVFNTDNDSAGVTVTAGALLTTTEAGGTAMFTMVLNSQPTGNVTIGLTTSDASEGSVTPAAAIFTPSNWNTAQTITVVGVDDSVADGAQPYTVVTGFAVSSDSSYNGLDVTDVSASNTDNDSAGITVTAAAGLTTTEAGGTASFTVVLNSQPTANVTLGLSSSDTSEGTVAASLTFTPANWNLAQTVTITGVDDSLDDGNQPYTIVTAPAASGDTAYAGLNPPDVSVTNTDNDAVGVTITAMAGLTVTEAAGAGRTATFTVVLNSEPTASVTIGLTSSLPAQGTVSPTSLTFTPANWNLAQTVTITGVDDPVDDGDISFSIITAAATSADPLYGGVDPANVTVTSIDNDASGITVTAAMGLTVTEAAGVGHTATFTVVLNSEPTANVTIGLTSTDITQATVAPAMLTFTPVNWSSAQTVTITGVDDPVDDGDLPFFIVTAAAGSLDSGYSGMNAADVMATAIDDDAAGIIVNAAMGLSVTEAAGAGHTATFTVVLTSAPTANVMVALSSGDTSEGTVAPGALTFTPSNWNMAQTVTITGVDDSIDDGDVMFSIVTAAAVSGDPVYQGLNPADVGVINVDNETAAITVTAAMGLTVTEAAGAGRTATFTVVLTSQPTADVTVGLSSSDPSEGTVSPGSLTFTMANWSTPQTVTITGVDDAIDDGDVSYSIVTAAATSTDSAYGGINPADVAVSTTDNDVAGVTVTPTSGLTVTEAPGVGRTASFTVVLTSEPLTDVLITITSADTSEGTVSTPFLTFTPSNWNVAQMVTITGVDDLDDDDNVDFSIVTGDASGTGSGYAGMVVPDVMVTNIDDE